MDSLTPQIGEAQVVTEIHQAPVVKLVNLRPLPQFTYLEEIIREAVVDALKACNGVQKDAAQQLGISARVINYKMKKLQIPRPQEAVRTPEGGAYEP